MGERRSGLALFTGTHAAVGHAKYVVAIQATVFTQLCKEHHDAFDAGIVPDHQVIRIFASRALHNNNIIARDKNRESHNGELT
jgi:hypothetical protein